MEKQEIGTGTEEHFSIVRWRSSFRGKDSFDNILEKIGLFDSRGAKLTFIQKSHDGKVQKLMLNVEGEREPYTLELKCGSITTIPTIRISRNGIERLYKCVTCSDESVIPVLSNLKEERDYEPKRTMEVSFGAKRDEYNLKGKDASLELTFVYPDKYVKSDGLRTSEYGLKEDFVDTSTLLSMLRNVTLPLNPCSFFTRICGEVLLRGKEAMPKIILAQKGMNVDSDLIESNYGQSGDFMLTDATFTARINKDGSWRCSTLQASGGTISVGLSANGKPNLSMIGAAGEDFAAVTALPRDMFIKCRDEKIPELIKVRDGLLRK